jgi:hypothetical protein
MATAPLVLLALSTLSVRALPGQDVGGPPKPAAADSVPAVDVPAVDVPAVDTPPADTLAVDASAADTLPPQQVLPPRLRLGMTTLPYPWDTGFDQVLEAYGSDLVRYTWTSARAWLADEDATTDRALSARADTLAWLGFSVNKFPDDFSRRRFLAETDLAEPDSLVRGVLEEQRIDILPDVLEKYADLELEVDGSGQLNSRWQTVDPCTVNVGQQCNASAVPTIAPEFQLRALARGTISERFHINVDFDQTREFNATNDLNVYYEGKPGEILEFAEVGQVTLPLPRSQYLSRGIPAGNFGFRGDARLGPLRLRGVLAEQKGNVLNRDVTIDVGGAGGESSVLQEFETTLDDAIYRTGQFFFLVDPRQIQGYPYIDVLALQGTEVADSLRPASSVKLYRHEVAGGGQQQNVQEGVIQARGRAFRSPLEDDPIVPDSVQFLGFYRPLVEGEDYIVHRSGLWAVIRSRIQRTEALAGTYIAVSGDTIGDYDAEEIFRDVTNTGAGELPSLELFKDAETHRPGGVTWDREMHNIYRISSSDDVEWGSVRLVVSQGPVESGPVVRVAAQTEYAFLEILGLDDQPRDDQLDDGRIWRPSSSGEFAGTNVLTGVYLVFPAQEPFKSPPPIQSDRVPSLQGQPFPLVDADKNNAIYDDPLDQARQTAFLYRLNLEYRARSAETQSSFSLGAIGIRRGSERVTLNGRDLTPGEDYTIDYDIGQLTLLRPGDLFAGAEDPQLAVRFEQKPLFQVGTTSILGFTGEYRLGEHGTIGMVGMLQKEGTVLTRPELGLEPSGVTLGGAVANFAFPSRALDNFVNSLPGIRTDSESRVRFTGELAASSPTTNRFGTTWVEDFEVGDGIRLGLATRAWRHGSQVSRPDVSGGFLPTVPDLSNQLSTVWQSQWEEDGLLRGPLLVNQIDPQLKVLNAGTQETVLWITASDPPTTGEPGWFSMTTVLSQTGVNLTTSEFLEFYASTLSNTDESLALIVDIGTISEDALVADSLGNPSGVGDLDQEVDPSVGVWGNQDDTGLWDTGCRSEPNASAWPLGDPRANCTNNNGLEDSEDLNRDNFLNTDERYFRYIVPLTQPSRYLNRPTNGEFRFNLYRVPLQLPDLEENTTGTDRQNVKHVRITVTSAVNATVLLSRLQFTGSPWLKRAGTGSVEGPIGDTPGTAAQVAVGTISTADQSYVSPPGISDQEADRTDELRLSSATINERSLQIVFSDIPIGERVEAYRKYTDRPRDFLPYGRLRAWSLAQGDDWGLGGSLRFFIRLGFDSNNFYMYRTPLSESPTQPTREDWLPEDFIDFGKLLALRAEAERLIDENGSNLPGDTTFVLWDVDVFPDADSTHALVINDRSRAPNLAAIRELALGIENVGTVDAGPGELWVDDLRLDSAPDDNGVAAVADLQVGLADVLTLQANVNTVNPFYRQLGETPSFSRQLDYGGRATLQVGKFLPDSWGLAMPVGFAYSSSDEDPFYLPQTDVLAAPLQNLRTGGYSETRWNVGLSKQTRSGSPLLRATIDGLRLGYTTRSSTRTATQTEARGSGWGATGSWLRQVVDKSFPIVPGFVRSAIDVLPGFISESVLLQNFKAMRFRWTPRQISLGADLTKSEDSRKRFQTSTLQATDSEVSAAVDLQNVLRPRTGLQIQPFPSIVWGFDFQSARDLVDPTIRASRPAGQEELERASRTFLGFDVGWETNRNVRTDLSWRPRLASWFDTDFTMNTDYGTNRNVSYIQDLDGDTTLVRDLSMERDLGLQFEVRPDQFLSAFGIAGSQEATGVARSLRAFWDRLAPVRIDWGKTVSSTYDRRDLSPTVWDQLVLTGFNSMRVMGSDTASAAGDTRRWSVRGGYMFPLGLDFDVAYRSSDRQTLTALSERRVVDREWPSLSVRWRNVPIPGILDDVLRDINVTGGWRTRETNTSTTTGQDRGSEQTVRSVGLLFVLPNRFNLTYDFDNTASERLDATGLSQSNRSSHSVRFSGFLQPPGFLPFVKNDMRLSLDYSNNGNSDCRALGGSGFGEVNQTFRDDCTTHSDQTTQNVGFALDTDFTGYSLGVQFTWAGRSSGVGRQQSSNQFNFNIFGRFFFRASEGQTQFNR